MSGTMPFTSVLVANRGEIALRIMKTVRAQGLRCIGVYTEADCEAPHVAFADQAVKIGEGPVADSYLSVHQVIDAAVQSGAQAVHPGYGFLSERAELALACAEAGLVFVGPPAAAIELMGNKANAKRQMITAGVPCVPGYQGRDQSADGLAVEARNIGFPVMIKAAAGGGGRGMRLVHTGEDLTEALGLARSEALNAFGSEEVILEKAILRPRHVEVQVLADRHGTVVHLGERDCSVQRRHQKVVEEAPCPVLSGELRDAMGKAAVEAARSIGYEGAGTVEFLLADDGAFYFLEMNTRLQVEHPVTELVTGHDLVALQLSIARGEPLGFSQSDVDLCGHAVEVRLYAEDPGRRFLPSTGRILKLCWPSGEGVRVDAGVVQGQVVSQYYDPMLAKIIAHADTRHKAVERLILALENTFFFGPVTNRDFLLSVLRHEAFGRGDVTTAFLEDHFDGDEVVGPVASVEDFALAGVLLYRSSRDESLAASVMTSAELSGWGSPGFLMSRFELECDGERQIIQVRTMRDGLLEIAVGEEKIKAQLQGDSVHLNGKRTDLRDWHWNDDRLWLATSQAVFCFRTGPAAVSGAVMGAGSLTAPMHGTVASLKVRVGERVEKHQLLAVLEAMKMQHELRAVVSGIVTAVYCVAGEQASAGKVLISIEEEEQS